MKRGYLVSWLRCVAHVEGKMLLGEFHIREAGVHEGVQAFIVKIHPQEYTGPTYIKTILTSKKYLECQAIAPF